MQIPFKVFPGKFFRIPTAPAPWKAVFCFENNLNVSETARKLFVHRNTLVYRLEKIKKLTGLDLREFDDAITFKVALMVKKYLTSRGIDS